MPDTTSLDAPFSLDEVILADVREAAEILVRHGRRAEALALVSSAIEQCDTARGQVLLARLHLESHTRDGATEALLLLQLSRCSAPWDLEAIALLRGALHSLGRRAELARLDRELAWTQVPVQRRSARDRAHD